MTDAAASLLEALGYTGSQRFVTPANMGALPGGELAFAFRRLAETGAAKGWSTTGGGFRGSYLLQDEPGGPAVPVVCILETESDADAREVHRVVWNQNLTPFVIVVSPTTIRLYPGFAYEHGRDVPLREVATTADTALRVLAAFTAEAIDDGTVWKEWGHAADPMQRADESLLRDLKELDIILQGNYATPREASHGLIGKFVYLYYLRHRDILSNRKLADWSIAPGDLFTPNATLRAFHKVNKELQDWLNGSVFTIGDEALADVTSEQLRLVAGIFCGNAPSGQLRFAFAAYNFSYIPIETLSCVYEQFLHDTGGVGQSRGKSLGAYYTPIPLADYMISELERKRPLRPGMKVLDPSCGSGAFLVQCYRRLIETQIRAEGRPLRKAELRSLLTENIFGIDRDADACRVTELSLILTLLDYVTPPDLEDTNFQLPTLRDRNIFEDDFFRDDGRWRTQLGDVRFDWVVGNPPWSEVKGTPPLEHDHYPVWQWMTAHAADCPTGGKQIAEAFLWKVAEHLDERGVAGLLVPAMTWFKTESVAFRRQFFGTRQVWCLANFANLAYVLFAGRSESPASAVFYRPRTPCQDDTILTFAPFVAEQVANRPERITGRRTTWNIVVNHSDVRDIPVAAAKEGSALTWKLAMWGSARDERLLHRISSRRDSTVQSLCAEAYLAIAEGIHLVKRSSRVSVSERRDLVGRRTVNFSRLKKVGRIFSFPPKAMGQVAEAKSFVRNRGGLAGLRVSQPPHLIVDCSRRFAVFSNKFILVPKSQLG
ncbi:MAG TPA: N-6 DNA methylase, partial [Candidatus Acidoferrales bacterium]|nr:N-6 DNA methylase [Candidatus Acidoferrales bacterium]